MKQPHDSCTCGGPVTCDVCRAMLLETPAQAVARMSQENEARGLRHAASFRAATRRLTPPDPYAAGLAKLRGAEGRRHNAEDQSHLDAAATHLHHAGAVPDTGEVQNVDTDSAHPSVSNPYRTNAAIATDFERRVTRPIPDPYRVAEHVGAVVVALTPHLDPDYDPRGTPPDGYAIALALRQAIKELA
jgi:hypothetical protein